MSIIIHHRNKKQSEDKMVKSELISRVVKKISQLPEKDVELGINQVFECMSDALSKGEPIRIRGFGSLTARYRPSRNAHNPKTGEKVVTLPKHAPYFKPGKELRNRINATQHIPIKKDDREEDQE